MARNNTVRRRRNGTRRQAMSRILAGLTLATSLAASALAFPPYPFVEIGSELCDPQYFENISPIGDDYARPEFVDIDGDGDLDMFVGTYEGEILFAENTGTPNAPVFNTLVPNPFGLPDLYTNAYYYDEEAVVTFGDLDGDGDFDAIVGSDDGYLIVAENTGTPNAASFVAATFSHNLPNLFDLASGDYDRAAPCLGDVDGDGDLDLFVGENGDGVIFIENEGSATAPDFGGYYALNPFGIYDDGSFGYGFDDTVPELADIDGDGDLDLFLGNDGGSFTFHENTAGAGNTPVFAPPQRGVFGIPLDLDVTNSGARYISPALGDLDGDGDLDLAFGFSDGDLASFQNRGTALLADFACPDTGVDPFAGIHAVAIDEIPLCDPQHFAHLKDDYQYLTRPELADIDGDGDLDMFRGIYTGDILFSENTGTAAAPSFAAEVFNPFGLISFTDEVAIAFGDLDGDGDLDAVAGTNTGDIHGLENVGTPAAPSFAIHATNFSLPSAVSLPLLVPDIADLDGDGDLDVFFGNAYAAELFFRNEGTAAVPDFSGGYTVDPFGLAGPAYGPSSISAFEFVDIDGDGDLDAFAGSFEPFSHVFENTAGPGAPGSPVDPVLVPFGGPPPVLGLSPHFDLPDAGPYLTPTLGDLDGDGDFDLVVGDVEGNMFSFENVGTALVPDFTCSDGAPYYYDADDSAPHFVDLDGDGDLDMVLSHEGNGMQFFENTGSAASPVFEERFGPDNPLDGIEYDGINYSEQRPAFADFDGDGDFDMVVGETSGYFRFFENQGDATTPDFVEQYGGDNPFDGIQVYFPALAAADIDGDGDVDLLVGDDEDGYLTFFENTGTPAVPAFGASYGTGFFGLPGGYAGNDLHPTLLDFDGDGDLDLIVGEDEYNELLAFENVGTPAAPNFVQRSGIDNPLDFFHDHVSEPRPAMVDIDGDGDIDVVVGTTDGDLRFLRNDYIVDGGDTTPPAIDLACPFASSDECSAEDEVAIPVTFDEPVAFVDDVPIELVGLSLVSVEPVNVAPGPGAFDTEWTVTVAPAAEGPASVVVHPGAFEDAAGNTTDADTPTCAWIHDVTAPEVDPLGDLTLVGPSTVQLVGPFVDFHCTVSFTEPVTGVQTISVSGPATMFNVSTVNDIDFDLTVRATATGIVKVGFGGKVLILDCAGNVLKIDSPTSITVTVEEAGPTVGCAPGGGPVDSPDGRVADDVGGANRDSFGASVAVCGDTAIIGAPNADPLGLLSAGRAYIAEYDGSTSWTLTTTLTAPTPTAASSFGACVAMSGDVAVVGEPFDDANGLNAGAVHVFRRGSVTRGFSGWTHEATLLGSDAGTSDRFGSSVAIDGDRIVVGAPYDVPRPRVGAVYVFEYAGSWTETDKLTPGDGYSGDAFGTSVSVSGDLVAVGSPGDDDLGSNSGSVYLYTWTGAAWVEEKATAVDGGGGDSLGTSVDVSGTTVVAGATGDDDTSTNSGAVYMFESLGATASSQTTKLKAASPALAAALGASVALAPPALAGKGAVSDWFVAAGAPLDDAAGSDAGAAHLFIVSGPSGVEISKYFGAVPDSVDYNGTSVDLTGSTLLSGAEWGNRINSSSVEPGSAYFFVPGP